MQHRKSVAHMAVILAAMALAPALVRAQAPPAGQPPAVGPSTAYQRAAQLQARIMDFKAEPASVQAGQPVNLIWSTENPSGVTIDPEIGKVTSRGSRAVSPSATTTYTLTVRGPNNQTVTRAVTVNVTGSVAAAANPSETGKRAVPRTPNGKPDLSGVYNNSVPNPGGGRGAGPGGAGGRGAPANAGPILKPGAEKYKVVRGANDAGQYADCMPVAPPQAFSVPYQFQIVQSAHNVLILHEYPGTFRIIPTDGPTGNATHPADPDPTWLGDSVGRWDGDTLVVDTIGFNDKTEINGYRHTDALHIVERFSRPEFDVVQYEATIEDPNVFAAPWKVTRSFGLRSELAKIDEFVCEHNTDYSKFFGKQ